jgi:hypothetical protein
MILIIHLCGNQKASSIEQLSLRMILQIAYRSGDSIGWGAVKAAQVPVIPRIKRLTSEQTV